MYDLIARGAVSALQKRGVDVFKRRSWIEHKKCSAVLIFGSIVPEQRAKELKSELERVLQATDRRPILPPIEPDHLYMLIRLKKTRGGWMACKTVVQNRVIFHIGKREIYSIACEVVGNNEADMQFSLILPGAIKSILSAKKPSNYQGPKVISDFCKQTRKLIGA